MTNPPTFCPCGDSYCTDHRPLSTVDRSDCCQYCGFFDCDVCGWQAPTTTKPTTPMGGDPR